MLNIIAQSFVEFLIKRGVVLDSEKAIIVYGVEIALSTLGYILSTTLTAILLSQPIFALLFIVFFMMERLFIGGYHSSTYFRCFVTTNAIFFSISMVTLTTPTGIMASLSTVIVIISFPYMFVRAPIVSPKNPLSKRRLDRDKKIGRIILVLQACVIILSSLLLPIEIKYIYFAGLSFFTAFILMLIPKLIQVEK